MIAAIEPCDVCGAHALPGSVFCAACDKADREGRASNLTYTVERAAWKAAKLRRDAEDFDAEAAYGRALAVALLDGRRQPTLAEVALHTLAIHDELVACLADRRESLALAVESAARMDAWVASKAVAA